MRSQQDPSGACVVHDSRILGSSKGGPIMHRTHLWCRVSFALLSSFVALAAANADETCMSPYMPKITGQEDYVYVWTLGVDGMGDGSDKLVTVGANPQSPSYGKVISSVSVGG